MRIFLSHFFKISVPSARATITRVKKYFHMRFVINFATRFESAISGRKA